MSIAPEMMKTVRVFFKKQGRCIYISHLDLSRAMGRALSRSGLPVWYTQGFHPHLYMTFALPLSLGVTGLYESMDFRLVEETDGEEIVKRLNSSMPEGLQAVSAGEPVMEAKEIFWADYEIELVCDGDAVADVLERLCQKTEILMEKRSKKGMREVDIRPMFSILAMEPSPKQLKLSLRCRAGVEINLNPTLLMEAALREGAPPISAISISRVSALNEELVKFK